MANRKEQVKLAERKFGSKKNTHKRLDLSIKMSVYELVNQKTSEQGISVKQYIEMCVLNDCYTSNNDNSKDLISLPKEILIKEIIKLKFFLNKLKEVNAVLMK